jgi:hypothetical protein
MSYEDQNSLSQDQGFGSRVRMCVAEQAQIFVNDDRAEFKQLAYQATAALDSTAQQFIPMVATRPGMSTASTDQDILAAVQYVWPIIGARYYTPEVLPQMQAMPIPPS